MGTGPTRDPETGQFLGTAPEVAPAPVAPAEQTHEVRVDGQVLAVTQDELEKGYARQAHMTRVTQEVAERQRILDERERQISERATQLEPGLRSGLVDSRQGRNQPGGSFGAWPSDEGGPVGRPEYPNGGTPRDYGRDPSLSEPFAQDSEADEYASRRALAQVHNEVRQMRQQQAQVLGSLEQRQATMEATSRENASMQQMLSENPDLDPDACDAKFRELPVYEQNFLTNSMSKTAAYRLIHHQFIKGAGGSAPAPGPGGAVPAPTGPVTPFSEPERSTGPSVPQAPQPLTGSDASDPDKIRAAVAQFNEANPVQREN